MKNLITPTLFNSIGKRAFNLGTIPKSYLGSITTLSVRESLKKQQCIMDVTSAMTDNCY